MKIFTIIRRRLLYASMAMIFAMLLCGSALAVGNIHFNKPGEVASTNILDESGSNILSSDLQRGSNQVEVFYGSVSAINPTKNSNVPPADLEPYDANYPRRYTFTENSHSIYFRVWSGAPHTKGSYFGYTNSGFLINGNQASYTSSDLLGPANLDDGTQNVPSYRVVKGFQTNRKYDNPYKPGIASPTESYVRIGMTNDISLKLVLSATYNDTQGGIIIPATSYKWRVWKLGR